MKHRWLGIIGTVLLILLVAQTGRGPDAQTGQSADAQNRRDIDSATNDESRSGVAGSLAPSNAHGLFATGAAGDESGSADCAEMRIAACKLDFTTIAKNILKITGAKSSPCIRKPGSSAKVVLDSCHPSFGNAPSHKWTKHTLPKFCFSSNCSACSSSAPPNLRHVV